MNDILLTIDAIQKQFGSIQAVDRLSFSLRRGEILALLGPNGAGKTTTVRMVLGIIHPDSGTVRFSLTRGDPGRPHPGSLGYLPEDRGLYKDVAIRKTLLYMAALRGMHRSVAPAAVDRWLERMDLKERAHDKLDTLSKGNQQKVQFISAIVHQPALAILDEPFAGLDPMNQELVLDCIHALRADGMTILLCAHQMNLVERIADRVLLMNRGRQLLYGTLSEIRQSMSASSKIFIKADSAPDLTPLRAHGAVERIETTATGELCFVLRSSHPSVPSTGGRSVGQAGMLNDFLQTACASLSIVSLRSEPVSLHDMFVDAVRRDDERYSQESAR